jgi:ferredoxin
LAHLLLLKLQTEIRRKDFNITNTKKQLFFRLLSFFVYLCSGLTIKTTKIMAYVISNDCVACGTCISECPSGAISEGEIYSIDPDACVDCGTCADVCPSGAIAPGE